MLTITRGRSDSRTSARSEAGLVSLSMRIGALRERLGEEDAALDAYHGAWKGDLTRLYEAAAL